MLRFDHLVISVDHLPRAMQNYRGLGFNVIEGGIHANGATQNALIVFADGTYIELMALTGRPPEPDLPDYSHLLQAGEGFVAYALASDDLDELINGMRERGLEVTGPVPGARQRPDGEALRWRTASIEGSMNPFFIEDETPRNLRVPDDPASITHANGTRGLFDVAFLVEDLSIETQRYRAILGTEPAIAEAGNIFTLDETTLTLRPAEAAAAPSGPAPFKATLTSEQDTMVLPLIQTHLAQLLLFKQP